MLPYFLPPYSLFSPLIKALGSTIILVVSRISKLLIHIHFFCVTYILKVIKLDIVCKYGFLWVCVFVCVYVCFHACVYVCAHMHYAYMFMCMLVSKYKLLHAHVASCLQHCAFSISLYICLFHLMHQEPAFCLLADKCPSFTKKWLMANFIFFVFVVILVI